MKLETKEAMNTYGGEGLGIIAGIGAAIAFIISAIDGYLNPKRCGQ